MGAVTMAPPIATVVGMAAQVFPGKRRTIEMQYIEVGGTGMPGSGAWVDHDALLWQHSASRQASVRQVRSSKSHAPRMAGRGSRPFGSGLWRGAPAATAARIVFRARHRSE